MAKKTIEKYYSDISGDEIDTDSPTLTFAFDGTTYEIDVTEQEKAKIEEALAPYIKAGRRATGAPRRGGRRSTSGGATGPAAKDVRAWAKSKGMEVPARGRIPAHVLEAYNQAH